MAREIAGGKDGHEQEPEDDEPSIAGREAHGLCDRGRRHQVVVFAHGVVAGRLNRVWLVIGSCVDSAHGSRDLFDSQLTNGRSLGPIPKTVVRYKQLCDLLRSFCGHTAHWKVCEEPLAMWLGRPSEQVE